ncbi:hypothetical protein BH09PSE3_BH09PSE3_26740 [soil metagenome]
MKIIFENAGTGEELPLLDQWLAHSGDMVVEGQDILVVMIAKTSVEIAAPVGGRLRILVEQGAIIGVGDVLGIIDPVD